jgi:ATP-dependent DNA helicase UvrD/PcrA
MPEFVDQPLKPVQEAISELTALNLSDPSTRHIDVLQCVAKHNLFAVPDSLKPFVAASNEHDVAEVENDDPKSVLSAWRDFLEVPYAQLLPYSSYVANQGEFGTHQGVKGLEFERVLVVLDDFTARGFLFNYEKVFGAKEPSSADKKKVAEGKETGIDRTTRLLYVTCTRAEKSLALVAYTDAPDAFITGAIQQGWFQRDEIVRL